MTEAFRPPQGARAPSGAAGPALHALVVDDSPMQRRILSSALRQWGYRVSEAEGGAQALAIARAEPVQVVVSDWMMPGMSGLDFCRAFRDLPRAGYGYFILLTSRGTAAEAAQGLDVGADDFLVKPVNLGELRARLRAGKRILAMEAELRTRNEDLGRALDERRRFLDGRERDLAAARALQLALIPRAHAHIGPLEVALHLRPCGPVGGDLVGMFSAGLGRTGVFALDVSGHGVSSALVTARLAGFFSSADPRHNIALDIGPEGQSLPVDPAEVARRLNAILVADGDPQHYATLLYVLVEHATGHVAFVQAGHPHPARLHASGGVDWLGEGGLPVGLFAAPDYETCEVSLAPGDRLLLHSDGFIESPGPGGVLLSEDGLASLMAAHMRGSDAAALDDLVEGLARWTGGDTFDDDLSAALLTWHGVGD